jgi:putative transposase
MFSSIVSARVVWYRPMARLARVVIVDVAHHVRQRGNGRQFILATDAERMVYLDLLRQAVHVVVIPRRPEALAEAFHQVHGRYAAYWNVVHASSGHVWQGRFYSYPMDAGHLWTALRYAELNPARAGMGPVWPWGSAAAHCGTADPDACLEMAAWRRQWSEASWRKLLEAGETEEESRALRRCTHTGRPLGSAEFVQRLEQGTERRLAPQKGDRQPKRAPDQAPQLVTLTP